MCIFDFKILQKINFLNKTPRIIKELILYDVKNQKKG